jgi:hypothetical protein
MKFDSEFYENLALRNIELANKSNFYEWKQAFATIANVYATLEVAASRENNSTNEVNE